MTELDIELTMIPRLGNIGIARLIEEFGDAESIFTAPPEELSSRLKLADDIIKHITRRSCRGAALAEMEYCRKHSITPIAIGDEHYPALLSQANDAPHVIYAKGSVEALGGTMLSIVGTRRMTPYGERVTTQIVDELSERVPNLTIVSGLAFGIDSAAHRAAVRSGVVTIAVLPNPLPEVTPVQHTNLARDILSNGGVVISELNSRTKMNGRYYKPRNRIIAAMSSVTLVVESGYDGGAISTAEYAFGYSREVMAVPGRITDITSTGCNRLIRDEIAKPVISSEDIIRAAMWDVTQDVTPRSSGVVDMSNFNKEQVGLLKYLNYCQEPPSMNHLLEITALDSGTLSMLLMELEFAGAIKLIPGQRYMLIKRLE
ncbi:MAG: DNA-processing protein DprA [Rikenellaceae bacterium]